MGKMTKVLSFKQQEIFGDRQLINTIIDSYGDYPNDSFITEGLCEMFTEQYREQANQK